MTVKPRLRHIQQDISHQRKSAVQVPLQSKSMRSKADPAGNPDADKIAKGDRSIISLHRQLVENPNGGVAYGQTTSSLAAIELMGECRAGHERQAQRRMMLCDPRLVDGVHRIG
jgi:hypothetical protein